ncbi:putative leader peptide [Saccharothrix coeruleofusca]|uniref:putative leader peptide n=1 Tax=Saccharothrix coeruleofusca TaxID=33919 RepID=UPI003570E2F0
MRHTVGSVDTDRQRFVASTRPGRHETVERPVSTSRRVVAWRYHDGLVLCSRRHVDLLRVSSALCHR